MSVVNILLKKKYFIKKKTDLISQYIKLFKKVKEKAHLICGYISNIITCIEWW